MKVGLRFLNVVLVVVLFVGVVGVGVVVFLFDDVVVVVICCVEVKGVNCVGVQMVKDNLMIQFGKDFSLFDIDVFVKCLYLIGFFLDVCINVFGGMFVVSVNENQFLNVVVFNGNKKFKDEKFVGVVQLCFFGLYSQVMIDFDIQVIKKVYVVIGCLDVMIIMQIYNVGSGCVNLVFDINEGECMKIMYINFVGNCVFGDMCLYGVFVMKEFGILFFIMCQDIYDLQKMKVDEDVLCQFYYNYGYVDFCIVLDDVQLNEKMNEYMIMIIVEEGEQYKIGNVNVQLIVLGVNGDDLKLFVVSCFGDIYKVCDIEKLVLVILK